VHLSQVAWRFWWLRGHAAELARLGDDFVAGSKDMPPCQHALALTQAGFILVGNGDPARGQQLLEQALPLYRQDNQALAVPVTMNALVLVVLGHLAARRRDYPGASNLLDQGQALLRELRDDDLSGYDRLQQQVTLALMDNVLGQVRLSQGDNDAAARLFTDGLAVARRAQDWSPCPLRFTTWRWPGRPRATWPARRDTCRRGWRWRPRPETIPAPPTISRSWRASPDSRTTRSGPSACSLPPARSWTPAVVAGCAPSCTRPARRCGPGRVALPHRRRGIPGGPGVGPVRREHTCGGIRP
jgi:hypothetical protein